MDRLLSRPPRARGRRRRAADGRSGRLPGGRRLPPPHRPQHLRERGRNAAPAGIHRPHHVAFVDPGREELGRAVQRLVDAGHPIDHASDHGATVSVYLADPDGNGVELYYDRPCERWFDAEGRPILKEERMDVRELLGSAR